MLRRWPRVANRRRGTDSGASGVDPERGRPLLACGHLLIYASAGPAVFVQDGDGPELGRVGGDAV